MDHKKIRYPYFWETPFVTVEDLLQRFSKHALGKQECGGERVCKHEAAGWKF